MKDPHSWLLEALVRNLLWRAPLPWHIEHDWTVEVLTKTDDVVMKCMNDEQATTLIALAERIAKDDKAASRKIEKMLAEPKPKRRARK